ncbi:MAG: hypothetical protein C0464_03120 [Cyanobacteria bacterium DS2.008]|jgi:hypothetical protein|nr:hypothetical protein [Cyanobacteria bacterium DS2.008]
MIMYYQQEKEGSNMSIVIGRMEFQGPILNSQGLKNEPGLFALLSNAKRGTRLVAMYHSSSIRTTIERLVERAEPTATNRFYAVLYTPGLDETQRQLICEDVRREHQRSPAVW